MVFFCGVLEVGEVDYAAEGSEGFGFGCCEGERGG